METAIFGAGCFWGVEAEFGRQPGVTATEVGYAGGHVENPTYEQVCAKGTGHAEVVTVTFDPTVTSYEKLLAVFFASHDPTTLNRQGPDVGDQYRSVIFTHGEAQRMAAEAAKEAVDASGLHRDPVVTAIEPLTTYYPAEDYHQKYFEKNRLDACPI